MPNLTKAEDDGKAIWTTFQENNLPAIDIRTNWGNDHKTNYLMLDMVSYS
jgi:hypothetical protein